MTSFMLGMSRRDHQSLDQPSPPKNRAHFGNYIHHRGLPVRARRGGIAVVLFRAGRWHHRGNLFLDSRRLTDRELVAKVPGEPFY